MLKTLGGVVDATTKLVHTHGKRKKGMVNILEKFMGDTPERDPSGQTGTLLTLSPSLTNYLLDHISQLHTVIKGDVRGRLATVGDRRGGVKVNSHTQRTGRMGPLS